MLSTAFYLRVIITHDSVLTLSQTSPDFYLSAVKISWKHCCKSRNCSLWVISPLPTVFSTFWECSAIFLKFKFVVCKLFQLGRVQNLSFGKGLTLYQRAKFWPWPNWKHYLQMTNLMLLNPFPHNDTFWRPWETILFPQCFLPVWITCCHFYQIWNCRLQTLSVWKSLKFVVC